jgi:urease gamma subunit|nr:MAG TPA: hypothetical protein [Crassvirales sp.]
MKKNKYLFVVDLTECEDSVDVFTSIADAKVSAGVAINIPEYMAIIESTIEHTVYATAVVESVMNTVIGALNKKTEKKDNIFKRFWNWLTNKK